MIILKPSFSILSQETEIELAKKIERAGRTCYNSEDLITDSSCLSFVQRMAKSGHEAMLEHASISVLFTCDRGVTHEIVRHRVASYAQESTRYCNYLKDKFGSSVSFIDIEGGMGLDKSMEKLSMEAKALIYEEWAQACLDAESHYLKMIELGASPQMARSVLNNSTKTEIVCTFNIREWRHFIKLRAIGVTGAPHPQMIELTSPLFDYLCEVYPSLFADLVKSVS